MTLVQSITDNNSRISTLIHGTYTKYSSGSGMATETTDLWYSFIFSAFCTECTWALHKSHGHNCVKCNTLRKATWSHYIKWCLLINPTAIQGFANSFTVSSHELHKKNHLSHPNGWADIHMRLNIGMRYELLQVDKFSSHHAIDHIHRPNYSWLNFHWHSQLTELWKELVWSSK